MFYDWPGGVACCFNDANAFFDYDTGVGVVVWGNERGEKGQVDGEWGAGHFAATANFFAEVFGCGLGKRCKLREC